MEALASPGFTDRVIGMYAAAGTVCFDWFDYEPLNPDAHQSATEVSATKQSVSFDQGPDRHPRQVNTVTGQLPL